MPRLKRGKPFHILAWASGTKTNERSAHQTTENVHAYTLFLTLFWYATCAHNEQFVVWATTTRNTVTKGSYNHEVTRPPS